MFAATLWAIQETSPRLGEGQSLNLADIWAAGGFMMWPLGIALTIGILIIIWKFIDLQSKAAKTRKLLGDVDEMIAQGRLYHRINALTARWTGALLVGFAVFPVPFDVAGTWAGTTRYPLWRFLALVTAGKIEKVTTVAFAGYFGLRWLIGPLV